MCVTYKMTECNKLTVTKYILISVLFLAIIWEFAFTVDFIKVVNSRVETRKANYNATIHTAEERRVFDGEWDDYGRGLKGRCNMICGRV